MRKRTIAWPLVAHRDGPCCEISFSLSGRAKLAQTFGNFLSRAREQADSVIGRFVTRSLLLAAAVASAAALAVCAEVPPSDAILQAMRDEVNRSVKLNLPNLETPYFVAY